MMAAGDERETQGDFKSVVAHGTDNSLTPSLSNS